MQNKRSPHQNVLLALPSESDARKRLPIASGVLDYFPLAIAEVSKVSQVGNDQHNPGQPLHWNRAKSQDHADTIARHLIERGTFDTDGVRHSAKVAWRALALLQEELEAEAGFKPNEKNGYGLTNLKFDALRAGDVVEVDAYKNTYIVRVTKIDKKGGAIEGDYRLIGQPGVMSGRFHDIRGLRSTNEPFYLEPLEPKALVAEPTDRGVRLTNPNLNDAGIGIGGCSK